MTFDRLRAFHDAWEDFGHTVLGGAAGLGIAFVSYFSVVLVASWLDRRDQRP